MQPRQASLARVQMRPPFLASPVRVPMPRCDLAAFLIRKLVPDTRASRLSTGPAALRKNEDFRLADRGSR